MRSEESKWCVYIYIYIYIYMVIYGYMGNDLGLLRGPRAASSPLWDVIAKHAGAPGRASPCRSSTPASPPTTQLPTTCCRCPGNEAQVTPELMKCHGGGGGSGCKRNRLNHPSWRCPSAVLRTSCTVEDGGSTSITWAGGRLHHRPPHEKNVSNDVEIENQTQDERIQSCSDKEPNIVKCCASTISQIYFKQQ